MKRVWTIRTQVLVLVLAAVAPLIALTAYNIQQHRGRARAEVLDNALTYARVIAARIDNHVQSVDSLMRAVAVLVGTDLDAVEANDARLRALQSGLPGYFSSLSVLAPDGRMINSSTAPRAERENLNFADRDYFREAVEKRGLALGKPIVSRTSGKWIMVAARPVLAADGTVRAVISASTQLDHFQDMVAPIGLPAGSVMTVVDGHGLVLARSGDPLKWIGDDRSANPDIRRARIEREYSAETVAADGVKRLAGYTTAHSAPWIVYFGLPSDIALARLRADLARLSALALIVIVAAALLAYLIARRITRPIEAIAEGARRVAGGTLDTPVETTGAAEIVNVAGQFNRMLESLRRFEHRLGENEERLRVAMITGQVGLQVWDHATHELYISPEWKRMLGYEDGEIANRPESWQGLLHPDDRAAVLAKMEAYFADLETLHQAEFRLRHRDGGYRWVIARASAIRGADGRPQSTIACYVDITDRKRAEDLLIGQMRILQEIAGGGTLAESLEAVCRLAEKETDGMLCSILLLDDDGTRVRHGAAPSLPAGYMRAIDGAAIGARAGSCGTAAFRGEPVIVEDIATDPLWEDYRALAAAHGLRACWSTPIFDARRRVLGTFAMYYREPRSPAAFHQRLIEIATHTAAIAITKDREQRRIVRLARIHAVLSGINSAIVHVRERPKLLAEACRIAVEQGGFGIAWVGMLDPESLDITPVASAGVDADSLIAKSRNTARSDLPLGQGIVGRAVRDGQVAFSNDIAAESVPGPGGARRREAVRRGYRSLISLPLTMEGAVIGGLSLFAREVNFFDAEEIGVLTELAANISFALEHMARQEKITKLSRIRAVSGEINAAIVRIHDRRALLEEACRIASETGGFEMAWVGAVDEPKRDIRAVAWSGFSAEIAGRVNWKTTESARGTLAEAVRTRRPAVRNDIGVDLPEGGMRGEALARGFRSTVCMPLLVDDKVVALMSLFAAGQGFFDKDEMALIDEVASDLSLALQTIARQEKLDYLSYYDTITGLPNRALFVDRAGQQMRSRGGEPFTVALILFNIERFRYINETFGRNGGDELLKLVAARFEKAFRGKDYLARVGADTFGVVVRGVRDATAVMHILENQVMRDCFGEPYRIQDSELLVAARAGIALFPTDGEDGDRLFRNAEAALKRARESGERYLFYASDMNARAAQALSLETRLRRAVEARQFVLHYQPKVSLATHALSGLEALIRWESPQGGLVPPGTFIPMLEETGLILEVGRWAIAQALRQHHEWVARGIAAPRIAVNVSAIQLQQRDFTDVVARAVEDGGGNCHALELEVTESLLMRDMQATINKLAFLRKLGMHVAMDDFGTGYSSLSNLTRLPLDVLKIDRSFIAGMDSSPQDMSIVTTIIALARALGLRVVAEGVETEAHSKLLALLKCDEAQGYYFSKPLPAREIETLFASPPWQSIATTS